MFLTRNNSHPFIFRALLSTYDFNKRKFFNGKRPLFFVHKSMLDGLLHAKNSRQLCNLYKNHWKTLAE